MSQQRSEQYLQSSHTHKQSPAGQHSSLLCRHELQSLQDCNPMGLPVKNTHIHTHTGKRDIGGNHCLEKWSSFHVRNWNWGYQMNAVEKKMLIIDCQPVQNIVQVSCYLELSPKFFPHSAFALRTVWPTFIYDAWCHTSPPGPYSSLLHHLPHS